MHSRLAEWGKRTSPPEEVGEKASGREPAKPGQNQPSRNAVLCPARSDPHDDTSTFKGKSWIIFYNSSRAIHLVDLPLSREYFGMRQPTRNEDVFPSPTARGSTRKHLNLSLFPLLPFSSISFSFLAFSHLDIIIHVIRFYSFCFRLFLRDHTTLKPPKNVYFKHFL